jgi:PKD repeat protein
MPSGAPLGVAFSSAGSSDPEGQPLTYRWDFGDGSQSTDANPVHTYPAPGSYTATLTVTDVGGLDASAELQVTVADPATQLRIASIDGLRVRRTLAKVTVKIVDGYGNPVRSVAVKGRWLGSTTTRTAYTNSQGIASFSRATSKPTEFTTTKVSRSRRTWDGVNASAAVPAL